MQVPPKAIASSSKENSHADGPVNGESSASSKLNSAVGLRLPDLAPEVMELFPRKRRDEGQTDILAAFVETISDLTAVFHELYPRQENKFEDVSSDESAEISSFERILTSSDPPSTKSKNNNNNNNCNNNNNNIAVERKENNESKVDDAKLSKK